MKLPVINMAGTATGEMEIADGLLIKDGKGSQAVHDTVLAYMANQRLGTAKTKQMGEVTGSGKKPWRQKGTGRARAGSFQSPLWRSGAVTFGPRPRDYSQRGPKKVKALAFRKALSERLLAGDIVVVDDLKLANHKTREFAGILEKLAAGANTTLIVTNTVDENLKRASRNLTGVQVERADSVNVYELLRCDKIVVIQSAMAKLQGRIQA